MIESTGSLLTVNKAMCRELKYSEEELLSMNIWDIIPNQYLDQYRKRLTKILNGQSLIDEVAELERVYGRVPNSMKAIGIVETLEYLDGFIGKRELEEKIATHTAQLAKRQQTFNAHQFALSASGNAQEMAAWADEWFAS